MNDTVTSVTAAASAPVADPQLSTLNSQPAAPLFPQAQGESGRAFDAFRVYLELGPKRRYATVARKVGSSYRTVQRWANDFDWRARIGSCAAHSVGQFVQIESAVQREDFLDGAARAKAFRERQYDLAEAMLAAAERYLERVDTDDLDLMSFADACKALEVASRLGQQAAARDADDPAASSPGLREQLEALLDQACAETPVRNSAPAQPQSPIPAPA